MYTTTFICIVLYCIADCDGHYLMKSGCVRRSRCSWCTSCT